MLKRIYSDTGTSQLHVVIKEAVSFKGIAIKCYDATQVGTLAIGEVGRVQYIKKGVTIIDAGFDTLCHMQELLGGYSAVESNAGAVLNFFCYIPRRFLDNNVEHVVPSDNAQLKISFPAAFATAMAAMTEAVEVFLDLEDGVQKYDLAINQYSETIAGASVRPVTYYQNNIFLVGVSATVAAVLTTAASAISQLSIQIGEKAGDMGLNALIDYTNTIFKREATQALMTVPYISMGDITSRLEDSVRLSFTVSGASNPETVIYSAMFTDDRLKHTSKLQLVKLQSQLARKITTDPEAIKVVQKVAG